MKTTNRIPKAIAVVLILSVGILYNMDRDMMKHSLQKATAEWKSIEKTDSLKASEGKLFIYSKSIIKSSIQHIISTI
jgi:hypothetical protein